MSNPTHFIEAWLYEGEPGFVISTCMFPIDRLQKQLDMTVEFGHKTVAVWYIKKKSN